jgi:hypothetical protein
VSKNLFYPFYLFEPKKLFSLAHKQKGLESKS